MNHNVVLQKLWRLAFITSPLLGLFGARPVFNFDSYNTGRLVFGLLTITIVAFLFFCLNIWLWYLAYQRPAFTTKWRYALSMVLAFVLSFSLYKLVIDPIMFEHFPPPMPPGGRPMNMPPKWPAFPVLQAEAINLIILTLIDLSYLKHSKAEIALENTKLRMANLEARHNSLLEQLHPHFLFNSLSTLSSLIRRDAAGAEAYLLKLSELLRSAMNTDQLQQVSLAKELELTQYYLDMQKVRFKDALHYNIAIPGSISLTAAVPVYSIRLLVENAIKHNYMTTENPLFINISSNVQENTITVCNNLQRREQHESIGGLGLKNLEERYQLIAGKHIGIEKGDSDFCVTIHYLHYESADH